MSRCCARIRPDYKYIDGKILRPGIKNQLKNNIRRTIHIPFKTSKKKPGEYPGSMLIAWRLAKYLQSRQNFYNSWQNRATLVGGSVVATYLGVARNLLLRLMECRLQEAVLTAGCRTINTL